MSGPGAAPSRRSGKQVPRATLTWLTSDAADTEAPGLSLFGDEHGVLDVPRQQRRHRLSRIVQMHAVVAMAAHAGINVLGVVHGCHLFPAVDARRRRAAHRQHCLGGGAGAHFQHERLCRIEARDHRLHQNAPSLELEGSNVSVSVVCPGVINTPIAQPSAKQRGKTTSVRSALPLGLGSMPKRRIPSVVAASVVEAVRSGRGMVLVGPYAPR